MEWEAIKNRLDTLLANGKHSEIRGAMMMLNVVDIAQYMETLEKDKLLHVFRILPKDISSDVFTYMEPEQKQLLIESIGDQEICALIDDMFLDDAVDFLEELPASVVKRVLQSAPVEKRNLINQFLRYPEYSAGSIMTIEYLEFHEGDTVRDAMNIIKKVGLEATDGTVSTGVFQKQLEAAGIEVILPGKEGQARVMEIIYGNVKAGIPVNIDAFAEVEKELVSAGAEVIILGCTELSMVKRDYPLSDIYLDALEVLARAAVLRCGKLRKEKEELILQRGK